MLNQDTHPAIVEGGVDCLVKDSDKPQIYKGQPYCSHDCRKAQGLEPAKGTMAYVRPV